MAQVPGVLLDHVHQHPPRVDRPASALGILISREIVERPVRDDVARNLAGLEEERLHLGQRQSVEIVEVSVRVLLGVDVPGDVAILEDGLKPVLLDRGHVSKYAEQGELRGR